MYFDKNQSSFTSDFRRDVWWWAVGLVPPADSLTDDVKAKCSPAVLEGCHQWYAYFNALCEDMYNNQDAYLPASPRQYRDILERIAAGGEVVGDSIVWPLSQWEAYRTKIDKSKAYTTAGVNLNQCLSALARTGLTHEYTGESVVFSHVHPRIFHAMHVMQQSPGVRNTPVRHHFAHCEFRQLFKEYAANYDELLRRASDESLHIAHAIHDYCKPLKIQRYIHFGIVKYKYKNTRILDFNLYGNEHPTLRINMGTCANTDSDLHTDAYYKLLLGQSKAVQDTFINNLVRCDSPDHKQYPITIGGRKEMLCPCNKIRINPFRQDLDMIIACISARKASVDMAN
ncbi:MAG: hypothetical protein FWC92_02825 [Defluviitaleaceae bacterium]|nr:hypothetical protein [Defluviitaleaceae bacterium]